MVQDGVEAIFQARTVTDECSSAMSQSTQSLRVRVGLPDGGEVVGPQQVCQHLRIDFGGFDLGLGNRPSAQGIADHDLLDMGAQHLGDGPGVGGRLHGEAILFG